MNAKFITCRRFGNQGDAAAFNPRAFRNNRSRSGQSSRCELASRLSGAKRNGIRCKSSKSLIAQAQIYIALEARHVGAESVHHRNGHRLRAAASGHHIRRGRCNGKRHTLFMINAEAVSRIFHFRERSLNGAHARSRAGQNTEIQKPVRSGDLNSFHFHVFIIEIQKTQSAVRAQSHRIKTVVSQISKRIVQINNHIRSRFRARRQNGGFARQFHANRFPRVNMYIRIFGRK